MRKRFGFIAAIAFVFILAACGANSQEQASSQPATEQAADAKKIKLGLTQFVEHPALDSVRKGILDGLAEAGFDDKKNLEVDFQSAHGEMNNTVTVAQKFAGDKKDIVVSITTPSSQAVAKAIQDVPVVFSTVTDPVLAELVTSLDKPDKNVTGTSDKVSMEKQLGLIQKFIPSIKKLGVLYTTSEVNAEVQVKELEEAAKAKGIELVKAGITAPSEVQLGTQSLAGKVEAILIPIDNTVVSAFDGVLMAAEKAKIPVFASDMDTVKRGAVATYGIDYYSMGKQTGEMVARILKGQKVSETPVEVSKETNLIINEKAASTFGLKISEELKKEAKEVIK